MQPHKPLTDTDRITPFSVCGQRVIRPGNFEGTLEPERAPEPVQLPAGLSPADFSPEQVAIIADWYSTHLRELAEAFFSALRAMPAGVELTPRLVGINAAIIAKLIALTPELVATPWREMAETVHCKNTALTAQKRAVIAALLARDTRLALNL